MKSSHVQFSDSLDGRLRVGVVLLKRVVNGPTTSALRERIEATTAEFRHTIGSRALTELEPVKRTRRLYHALGADPTKDRPASERLLRRVVREQPFPEVNQLVDALNLVSLSLQCPVGAYDWDQLAPPVLVRIGRPDETFIVGAGRRVRAGGRMVLVDGDGLFGSPSQDSSRAAIEPGTVRALVVTWFPADVSNAEIENATAEVIHAAETYCEAAADESGILG